MAVRARGCSRDRWCAINTRHPVAVRASAQTTHRSAFARGTLRTVNRPVHLRVTANSDSSLMPTLHSPMQIRLFAALPAAEFDRLSPHLEWVTMPLGEVIYESGGQLQHVYFPTTSIVSLLYVLENGASAEIAVVGNEGILGISLFMGGETTPSRAVVQSAGHGYRLEAQRLKQEFNRAGPVLRLLLRYTQALLTQMPQAAVCDRQHARCAPRRGDPGRREFAARRFDTLQPWPYRGARPAGTGKDGM